MRVCLVIHELQEFGGLEEYATSLGVALKQAGQDVSVLSDAWAPAGNQYVRRLREAGVRYVQPPKWLSLPASDWQAKERILRVVVAAATPLVYLAAVGLFIVRRAAWRASITSARNRLQAALMTHVIGPHRGGPLGRMLLRWWRLWWRPDLLHLQGYSTGLLYVIDWAVTCRLPVAYEEHQTPDPQFDWWQGFHATINKATVVIAVSDESARKLRSVCGVTRPIVVRSSVLPDPMALGWRRADPSPDALMVTTVARLYVTKGLTYLLETIALSRDRIRTSNSASTETDPCGTNCSSRRLGWASMARLSSRGRSRGGTICRGSWPPRMSSCCRRFSKVSRWRSWKRWRMGVRSSRPSWAASPS